MRRCGVVHFGADLNGDGVVDAEDLAILLGSFGRMCEGGGACSLPGDLNGDGAVNTADLAILLGSWGRRGIDLPELGDGDEWMPRSGACCCSNGLCGPCPNPCSGGGDLGDPGEPGEPGEPVPPDNPDDPDDSGAFDPPGGGGGGGGPNPCPDPPCEEPEPCEASAHTTTHTIALPAWDLFKSALETAASAVPIIQSIEFAIQGSVSRTDSETCCEWSPTPPTTPGIMRTYSGSVAAGVDIELALPVANVPPFEYGFPGLGSVSGQFSFGPVVAIEPSVSVSISGWEVLEIFCPGECVTLSAVAQLALQAAFQGVVELAVHILPGSDWVGWGATVQAQAGAQANTNGSLTGQYNLPDCSSDEDGWRGGELCIAGVEGAVVLKFQILDIEYSFELQRELISKNCWDL